MGNTTEISLAQMLYSFILPDVHGKNELSRPGGVQCCYEYLTGNSNAKTRRQLQSSKCRFIDSKNQFTKNIYVYSAKYLALK